MRTIIRKITRPLGFDVVRYPFPYLPTLSAINYHKLLSAHCVDVVLDVGANTGQYAKSLIKNGYNDRIVSFEPMTLEHDILKNESSNHPNWIVAERTAIGEKEGVACFNVSKNSVSSSLLPIKDSTVETCPSTEYVSTEEVNVSTLNVIGRKYIEGFKNPFLKLDIQGYEYYALVGAKEIIDKFVGLHVELGLSVLYEGEKDLMEMLNFITHDLGFKPHYFIPHSTADTDGKLLQVDVVFYNDSSGETPSKL